MPLVHDNGHVISDADAQDRIRRTIERTGKFILFCSFRQPPIGEVNMYAGLPMRVVKHTTMEEAIKSACYDIWETDDQGWNPNAFYFEVEVAD